MVYAHLFTVSKRSRDTRAILDLKWLNCWMCHQVQNEDCEIHSPGHLPERIPSNNTPKKLLLKLLNQVRLEEILVIAPTGLAAHGSRV